MPNANPSIDPANYDTLVGTFRHIAGKIAQELNVALPARVIAFDRGPPAVVNVQPLITVLTTAGEAVPRAPIASAPVVQIGGGGYFMSFNLVEGDQGLLIACDRDISGYLQSASESQPSTVRTHDFSDSFFIPLIVGGYTIAAEDAMNAVLQNLAGTIRLSLMPDQVKITGNLRVEGEITALGSITPNVPDPP